MPFGTLALGGEAWGREDRLKESAGPLMLAVPEACYMHPSRRMLPGEEQAPCAHRRIPLMACLCSAPSPSAQPCNCT